MPLIISNLTQKIIQNWFTTECPTILGCMNDMNRLKQKQNKITYHNHGSIWEHVCSYYISKTSIEYLKFSSLVKLWLTPQYSNGRWHSIPDLNIKDCAWVLLLQLSGLPFSFAGEWLLDDVGPHIAKTSPSVRTPRPLSWATKNQSPRSKTAFSHLLSVQSQSTQYIKKNTLTHTITV